MQKNFTDAAEKDRTMTAKKFDLLANEMFGKVLLPLGFTNEKSHACTFYRMVGNQVFHFIMPGYGQPWGMV